MQFESTMGEHKLTTEGPQSWGGSNQALMPPQIFMASIGSCVEVLVTHFCDTHGLDANGVNVDVDYDTADHPTRFTNIHVTVRIPNARYDDACTHRALAHVAEHCPIHETTTTMEAIKFTIETADSQ